MRGFASREGGECREHHYVRLAEGQARESTAGGHRLRQLLRLRLGRCAKTLLRISIASHVGIFM